MIFYTHVEHSPTKTIYIKYCKKKKEKKRSYFTLVWAIQTFPLVPQTPCEKSSQQHLSEPNAKQEVCRIIFEDPSKSMTLWFPCNSCPVAICFIYFPTIIPLCCKHLLFPPHPNWLSLHFHDALLPHLQTLTINTLFARPAKCGDNVLSWKAFKTSWTPTKPQQSQRHKHRELRPLPLQCEWPPCPPPPGRRPAALSGTCPLPDGLGSASAAGPQRRRASETGSPPQRQGRWSGPPCSEWSSFPGRPHCSEVLIITIIHL